MMAFSVVAHDYQYLFQGNLTWLVTMPRQILEIKDFLLTARRKDAKCKLFKLSFVVESRRHYIISSESQFDFYTQIEQFKTSSNIFKLAQIHRTLRFFITSYLTCPKLLGILNYMKLSAYVWQFVHLIKNVYYSELFHFTLHSSTFLHRFRVLAYRL